MKREDCNLETKQAFLSSAISDISSYIQLADTKVSIIMAAVVAILVGISSCYELLGTAISKIVPCSWIGVLFIISSVFFGVSTIAVFIFGLMTVSGHKSIIYYKSKWFLSSSTKEYSFTDFSKDIDEMTEKDIIENMAAELYKLNDINRQKMKSFKWTMIAFASFLVMMAFICLLLLINII